MKRNLSLIDYKKIVVFKYIRTLNYSYMARTFNVIPQFNTNVLLTNDNTLLFQAGRDPADKKQCSQVESLC